MPSRPSKNTSLKNLQRFIDVALTRARRADAAALALVSPLALGACASSSSADDGQHPESTATVSVEQPESSASSTSTSLQASASAPPRTSYPDCKVSPPNVTGCGGAEVKLLSSPKKCGLSAEGNLPNERCASLCGNFETRSCRVYKNRDGELGVFCDAANPCLGRLPSACRAPRARAGLAPYLARATKLEALSVGAFVELEAELQRFGAPAALGRACRRAATDEERHAASMARLTRRFSRRAPTLGASRPIPRGAPPMRGFSSLAALALANERDGVVGEAWAATLAAFQATASSDAGVRRAMRAIAREELEHAALSLRVSNWARALLSERDVKRLDRMRARSLARIERDAHLPFPGDDTKRTLGWPTPVSATSLAESLRAHFTEPVRGHRHAGLLHDPRMHSASRLSLAMLVLSFAACNAEPSKGRYAFERLDAASFYPQAAENELALHFEGFVSGPDDSAVVVDEVSVIEEVAGSERELTPTSVVVEPQLRSNAPFDLSVRVPSELPAELPFEVACTPPRYSVEVTLRVLNGASVDELVRSRDLWVRPVAPIAPAVFADAGLGEIESQADWSQLRFASRAGGDPFMILPVDGDVGSRVFTLEGTHAELAFVASDFVEAATALEDGRLLLLSRADQGLHAAIHTTDGTRTDEAALPELSAVFAVSETATGLQLIALSNGKARHPVVVTLSPTLELEASRSLGRSKIAAATVTRDGSFVVTNTDGLLELRSLNARGGLVWSHALGDASLSRGHQLDLDLDVAANGDVVVTSPLAEPARVVVSRFDETGNPRYQAEFSAEVAQILARADGSTLVAAVTNYSTVSNLDARLPTLLELDPNGAVTRAAPFACDARGFTLAHGSSDTPLLLSSVEGPLTLGPWVLAREPFDWSIAALE